MVETGFSWDSIESETYEFANIIKDDAGNGSITLKFTDDEPCKVSRSRKFNNTNFMFKVYVPDGEMYRDSEGMKVKSNGENKVFTISSIKLMEGLKEHLPIKDKVLTITSSGKNYDTNYVVEEN